MNRPVKNYGIKSSKGWLTVNLKCIFLCSMLPLKTFTKAFAILLQLFSIKYHYSLPERSNGVPSV